jgi:uncharacterized membrane protein YccF (DUF307 family)
VLRIFLNILWIVFGGGFIIWLEYVVVGLLLCATVIGIPFGVQCFKVAGLGLLPFGKNIERARTVPIFSGLGNIVWLVFAGLWIFLSHVALAVGLTVTIIGIPFAVQHIKLALLALWPFGHVARAA